MNNEKSQAFLDQMKGAILEVLLVSAKGIDRTHILGTTISLTSHSSTNTLFIPLSINVVGYGMLTGHPGYHVIVECGSQVFTSKTSSGSRRDRLLPLHKSTVLIVTNTI